MDSQVSSFSKLPPAVPAGATYRFERLPSQQSRPEAQAGLEAMATPALEAVGLRRDDAMPRFTVQVDARVDTVLSPWADPWLWGPGPGWGWGGWGPRPRWRGAWHGPAFPPPAQTWFVREVSVVMRELPGGQVVYETRARHDGPFADSRAVLPAMFSAALQGFPQPPAGERRVDVQIGRRAAPDAAAAGAPR